MLHIKLLFAPIFILSTHKAMDYEKLEKYLLGPKGSLKEFPFGPEAAVFKVAGKMFALVAWTLEPLRITLKCQPEEADFLRSRFASIIPGYYMNKKHWNTIILDDSIPEDLLVDLIETSYALVLKGLTKTERHKIAGC